MPSRSQDSGGGRTEGPGASDPGRAAAERQASVERQAILDTMAQGVSAFDAAGRVLYRNAAARQILGLEDDAQIPSYVGGEHPLSARRMDGSFLSREEHPAAHALRGRSVRGVDLRMRRLGDGRAFICRYDAEPLRDADGAVTGAILTFQDITEQVEAAAALRQREELLRLAQEAGRIGSFSWDVASGHVIVSGTFAAIYGRPDAALGGPRIAWIDQVHPEDRAVYDRKRAEAFERREEEFLGEFRILRPDGEQRWISSQSRAEYDAEGRPLRVVGVQVDVTERKEAEERQGLLVAELDHRVRNVLAVVQAMAQQTVRSDPAEAAAFAGRLAALARAHGLAASGNWGGVGLRAVLDAALAPHADVPERVALEGRDLMLTPRAAQTLSLAFHELATNAAKYGALAARAGRLQVRWAATPEDASRLLLDWRESGGPAVEPPSRRGFGSELVQRSLEHELCGRVVLEFPPTGLVARLELPLAELVGRP